MTGVSVNPGTIYASPNQVPNFTSKFTLKETAGSSVTFTQVALAIHLADGTYLFDVGIYNNVTIAANGTWDFPETAKFLAAPGTYQAIAKGRVNNGGWFNFCMTGSGVNPRAFTVQPGVSVTGRVVSAAAGNPPVVGATVNWGGRQATTDANGNYSFNAVPCQTSQLTVSVWGYDTYSVSYTPTCNVANTRNVTLSPWGNAGIGSGVTITPASPFASPAVGVNNFTVNFALHETTGFPVTFAEVAVAILDANNNYLFDLEPPNLQNVTVPAGGTWTYPGRSGYLVNPGVYKAVVRGHVAGGNWFDFFNAGGTNMVSFTVRSRPNPVVSVSPGYGIAGTTFSQPGSGFTPNSTVELHFKKPPPPGGDGLEYDPPYPTAQTNSSGSYSHTYQSSTASMWGTYEYWAIDLASGVRSNTATFQLAPPPVVSVSPSLGVAGTSFSQPGSGFTPNSTVELHFKKPPPPGGDGLEYAPPYPTATTNASGSYSHTYNSSTASMYGIYEYWAIDLATGIRSNTATFQLDPVAVSVNSGVTVSPGTIYASPSAGVSNFSVDFSLSTNSLSNVTLAEVAVAILDGTGNYLFDLAPPNLTNVIVPAGGSWPYPHRSGYLVNPGTYRAVVRARFPGGTWFDVPAASGGTSPRQFTVLPAGAAGYAVTGVVQVEGQAGIPVPGAAVRWGDYSTITRTDGSFDFVTTNCGSFELSVDSPGFEPWAQPVTVTCSPNSFSANTTTNVMVGLRRGSSPLQGNITGPFGEPVHGAEVALSSGARTRTDASGHYQFDSCPCRPLTLKVTAAGYPDYSAWISPPVCRAPFQRNIQLSRVEVVVSGTVTDRSSHARLAGALVKMGGQTVTTDEQGEYSFAPVTCDPRTFVPLRVERSSYRPYKAMVKACTQSGRIDVGLASIGGAPESRVVLVHGICADNSMWGLLAQDLSDAGFEVQYAEYDPRATPGSQVPVLEKVIARSPKPTYIVAHSMGGLIARAYLKKTHNIGNRIRALVTISTPHHGADIPLAVRKLSAVLQLAARNSSVIRSLKSLDECHVRVLFDDPVADMMPGSPFLNQLNYGDEKIGGKKNPRWERGMWGYSWQQTPSKEDLEPTVKYYSIAGTGRLNPSLAALFLYLSPVADDGVVSTSGAHLYNPDADNEWDSQYGVVTRHSGPQMLASGDRIYESPAVRARIMTLIATLPDPSPQQSPALVAVAEGEPEPANRTLMQNTGTLDANGRLELPFSPGESGHLGGVVDCEDCTATLLDASGQVVASVEDTVAVPGAVGPASVMHPLSADLAGTGDWHLILDAGPSAGAHNFSYELGLQGVAGPMIETSDAGTTPGEPVTVTVRDTLRGPAAMTSWFGSLQRDGESALDLALNDAGSDGDKTANDGTFSYTFLAPSDPGTYDMVVRGVNSSGGATVDHVEITVLREGNLKLEPSTLSVTPVDPGDPDSVVVRVAITNVSPYDLDEAQVHLWQDGQELADSAYVSLSAWQSDTLEFQWRVAGGSARGFLSVSTATLDEDSKPEDDLLPFAYANGVLDVEADRKPGSVRFYAAASPNPARTDLTIHFGLSEAADVSLKIFDIAGREVTTLARGPWPAGDHEVTWNAGRASARPGCYFYELRAGMRRTVRRVVLLH